MSSFPQELIDAIIDHFQDNPSTLLSCSKVHRSWTHRSRVHLVPDIFLDCQRPTATDKILSFHGCLSKDPLLVDYITSVELRNLHWNTSTLSGHAYEALSHILNTLLCVRRLSLQNVRWHNLPISLRRALVDFMRCPSLSTLKLTKVTAPKSSVFAGLLSAPSRLKILQLENISADDRQGCHPTHAAPKLGHCQDIGNRPLEVLDISTSINCWMLRCLFHPNTSLNLHSLRHVGISRMSQPHAVDELLRLLGQSLEHLVLNVHSEYGVRHEHIHISLMDMPWLRMLEFKQGVTEIALISLFGNLRQDHRLEEIRVVMPGSVFGDLGWSEPYYSQPRLPELRRVEYQVVAGYVSETQREFLPVGPNEKRVCTVD